VSMRDNFSPDAPWEDDDGAGLDEESVLDAFDEYAPAREPVDVEDAWTAPELPEDNAATTTVLFTATNPAGTVSVTVLMGGQVLRVNLSPQVTKMTEPELAEEITTIAALARQQAQAGQHAIIAHLMHQLGRDPASTRSFLERDIGLPSPESVRAERATLFAARYAQDQD
jgi:DNA-binding protein YbaB